jgi:hypothetical protein
VGSVVGGIALLENDDLGRFVMHVITLSDGGRNIAVRYEIEVIKIGLLVKIGVESHQAIQGHGTDGAPRAVFEQNLGFLKRLLGDGIELCQVFKWFPIRTHRQLCCSLMNKMRGELATQGGFLSYFWTTILFAGSTTGKNGCQQYGNCD